jgi:hypothetical protein
VTCRWGSRIRTLLQGGKHPPSLRAAGWDEFVDNTARHRLDEAREVGAQIVASACPNSEDNLAAVAPDFSIRVANVVDLLHASVMD